MRIRAAVLPAIGRAQEIVELEQVALTAPTTLELKGLMR